MLVSRSSATESQSGCIVTAGLVVAYFPAMGRNAGLLLLCLAGLAVIATGCGGSSSSTALRIDLTYGAFGSRSYVLRCSPAAGTVSKPSAVCAAIKTDKTLLVSHPGADHSCPYGPPRVHVIGRSGGQTVDAQFSVCTAGQEHSAARWNQLVGYGPLWVQTSSHVTGTLVSVRLRIAHTITRTYQYGVVTEVRVSSASASPPVYAARAYYGFDGLIQTRLQPGKYVLSTAIRECLGNCDRLSAPRRRCQLGFAATKHQTLRLDVRLNAGGACVVQIEQHG
jgi:hypothetical protein